MSFLINRMRVTAKGAVAYDQTFALGVNVVEGENSSGKSTLFKLLYHGIGGFVPARQWSDAAQACDRVYVEIQVGAVVFVATRKIAITGYPSVLVIDGTLEEALQKPIDQWREFSYSRSESAQSFSQMVFALLGMPEAFSENGDFMTFNQFLRAHYSDQESPNTTILRYEDQFDKPSTREAVGTFILGGVDHQIAEKERILRDAEKGYAQAISAVAAGNLLLGSDYSELSFSGLDAAESRIKVEIEQLEVSTSQLRATMIRPIEATDIDQSRVADITNKISEIKSDLSDRLSSKAELELEARDSEMFIRNLQQRSTHLVQSLHTASDFGELDLDSCPACGTPVDSDPAVDHCYLCKSSGRHEVPTARYLSLLNSNQTQIDQSRQVQEKRILHIAELDKQVEAARSEMRRAALDLEAQRTVVSTESQSELSSIQNRLGFLQSELERLKRDKKVVERLDVLRNDRDRLSGVITELRDDIERERNSLSLRLGNAMSAVSRDTGEFLLADLDRQLEFHNNPHVELDYRNNSFSLGGQKAFSASSTSYLRNSIFLGTLFAADRVSTMRHLHLLLLENLEDKGMEPERYHRLHQTIVSRSETLHGDWQILIATADLAPEVREKVNIVGGYYSHDRKTLNLPANAG